MVKESHRVGRALVYNI